MQTFAATLVWNNPDICQDPTDAEAGNPHEVVWKKVTEGRVEAINAVKSGQQTQRGKQEEAILSAKTSMMQKKCRVR